MNFEELIKKELDGILAKIDKNMLLYKNKTPHINGNLKYSENLTEDGNWTGSFWFGMVVLAVIITQNEHKYKPYLDSFKEFYFKRVRNGYKDHDLGFLYQLYAVDAYRVTCDMDYLDMADMAARCLYSRYNPNGGFIRAWSMLGFPEREGKTIIDCMMNLPLLFSVAKSGGDARYYEAAKNHAFAALNNIREDGTVYHTFDFDVLTGKPIKGENEGGYADESCWSRGLAWAVYGFYLAWMHTKEQAFLDASIKTADCFMANVKKGEMPLWDFRLDDENDKNIDTSAAAIAACGMYQLAEVANDNKYREFADDMLYTLITKESHVFDDDSEALLGNGMCGSWIDGKRRTNQWATIWGDYFYMEALTLRSGLKVRMWDM